jgi:membrane protease YdiL (CAAX protease family)
MVGVIALVALTPCALGDVSGGGGENIGPRWVAPRGAATGASSTLWFGAFHTVWAIAAGIAIWRRGWVRLAPLGRARHAQTATVAGAGVVLIAGGVVISCAQLVGAASAAAILGRGDSAAGIASGDHGPWWQAGLMLGSYVGALATLIFVVAIIPGIDRLAGLPTRGRRWRSIRRGVVRGITGIAVVYPLAWVAGWMMAWVARWVSGPESVDPLAHETLHQIAEHPVDAAWWALSALVVLGAPVVEEVVYRGFFQPGIAAITEKRWLAIWVTSAVFALMHVNAVPWHAVPVLFLLSIGFGVARERTGSVVPSMVMHVVFNGANVAMVGMGV